MHYLIEAIPPKGFLQITADKYEEMESKAIEEYVQALRERTIKLDIILHETKDEEQK